MLQLILHPADHCNDNQSQATNKIKTFNLKRKKKKNGKQNDFLLRSLRRNMQRGSSRLKTSIFRLSSSSLVTYSSSLAILLPSSSIEEASLEKLVMILVVDSFRSRPRSGAMIFFLLFSIDFFFSDGFGFYFCLFCEPVSDLS